jgi:hypothetical protein
MHLFLLRFCSDVKVVSKFYIEFRAFVFIGYILMDLDVVAAIEGNHHGLITPPARTKLSSGE